jgi:hypothetical protein
MKMDENLTLISWTCRPVMVTREVGSSRLSKIKEEGATTYVILKMIPYKFSNYWRSPMSGNFLPYCYQISARMGSIPRTHFRKKAQRNCFWIIITKG